MPESASAELMPLALAHDASVVGVAVGGGSDGNFTAARGVPTLDGLGAVGGGAHADHEYVEVETMPGRQICSQPLSKLAPVNSSVQSRVGSSSSAPFFRAHPLGGRCRVCRVSQ